MQETTTNEFRVTHTLHGVTILTIVNGHEVAKFCIALHAADATIDSIEEV